MEMMFLILLINREGVVIPQSYPKEQCEKIASGYETIAGSVRGFCIPAPVFKYSTSDLDLTKCFKDTNMPIRCNDGAK